MNRILEARTIGPQIKYFRVEAPKVARKRRAGQFVIVRVTEDGERIPLTIADGDPTAGWIALVVQGIGKTTRALNQLETGDFIQDLAGPLGMASEIPQNRQVAVVGGGVGTAIAYPTAVALAEAGNDVVAIVGGRSREHVILEEELQQICSAVYPTTDDGSYGHHGLVTDKLQDLLESPAPPNFVMASGPVPMMRAVAETTRPYGVETVVSLNPIMVDGTGMCGGCRVSVGGETKFACVDGPDFDAHEVDFELLARRNRTYGAFEHYRNAEFIEDAACRADVSGVR